MSIILRLAANILWFFTQRPRTKIKGVVTHKEFIPNHYESKNVTVIQNNVTRQKTYDMDQPNTWSIIVNNIKTNVTQDLYDCLDIGDYIHIKIAQTPKHPDGKIRYVRIQKKKK